MDTIIKGSIGVGLLEAGTLLPNDNIELVTKLIGQLIVVFVTLVSIIRKRKNP